MARVFVRSREARVHIHSHPGAVGKKQCISSLGWYGVRWDQIGAWSRYTHLAIVVMGKMDYNTDWTK